MMQSMRARHMAVLVVLLAWSGSLLAQENPATTQFVLFEQGLASWYGQEFHGRPTANGEIYDSNQLTAAHKTLPFNTRVRVTDISTGKSVVVRINDRGPFVAGRNIDLSRAAAETLGIIGAGVAGVRIEVERATASGITGAAHGFGDAVIGPVASPSPDPVIYLDIKPLDDAETDGTGTMETTAVLSPAPETRTVQIASFSNATFSQKLIDLLKQHGLGVSLESSAISTGAVYHRVVIRDLPLDKLPDTVAQLARLGYTEVLVRQR